MPFRIIREAIEGKEKSEIDRERERERERERKSKRKKEKEGKASRQKRRAEEQRGTGAPGCYFVLLFVYFLSFREGPKKSSHAARERDPEHARRQARTNARTHSPLRGKQKTRGARGILISSCSLIFSPLFGPRWPCRDPRVQRAKVSPFSLASERY